MPRDGGLVGAQQWWSEMIGAMGCGDVIGAYWWWA